MNPSSMVIVKVIEELSQIALFESVITDNTAPETEIFNYFANVSTLSLTLAIENVGRGQENGESRSEEITEMDC